MSNDVVSLEGHGAKPAQGLSLTEQAYRRLEEMIVTLELEPGQVLSEMPLAERLGIGRTPIREALQRLAREGLVVILPRRGVLVSEINVRRQLELLKVRREVERLMARLAANRGKQAERDAFLALSSDMERTAADEDNVGFMRLDREFNSRLASACRNEFAMKAMTLMQGLSRRFWYMHYMETLDLPRCARLHAATAEAVGKGLVDDAAEASDRLIDYLEEFTRATLDRGHPYNK